MMTLSAWFTPQHIAGFVAILVGVIDHWAFHDGFGLMWDEALVYGGIVWLGGVAVPSPIAQHGSLNA